MARYKQLDVRRENLYKAGSPVVICAEALLVDNKQGVHSAQVKFSNVGSLDIDGLVAEYRPEAIMDKPLDPVVYLYRCVNVKPGDEFGQNEPVRLPDETVRFTTRVLRVSFTDGTTWEANDGAEWTPLQKRNALLSTLGSLDLLQQYSISVGAGMTYAPTPLGDGSWSCGCGAINGPTRTTCLRCGTPLETQKKYLNKELLESERTSRLEREALEAEKEAQREAERLAEEAKAAEQARIEAEKLQAEREVLKRKRTNLICIICGLVCVAICAYLVYNNVLLPKSKYDAALAKAEEGRYEEAIADLKALGDYSDAAQQAIQIEYDEATYLYESGDFEAAYRKFDSLAKSYNDDEAQRMRIETAGSIAKAADEAGDYLKAVAWYEVAEDDESLNRAKYAYIKDHLDHNNEKTFQYLTDLKKSDYRDAAKLYSELFDWSFEFAICTNDVYQGKNWVDMDSYDKKLRTVIELLVRAKSGPPNQTKTLQMDEWHILEKDQVKYTGEWIPAPGANWGYWTDKVEVTSDGQICTGYMGVDSDSEAFKVRVTDPDTGEVLYEGEIHRND